MHTSSLLAAALLASGLARAAAAQAPQTPWPTTGWPTTTPAAAGLDAAVLDSLDAEIRAGRHGYVDRLLVIRGGRVAFDRRYRQDYDRAYGDSARAETALSSHDLAGPYNYFNAWWHPYYRRGDLHTLQSVTKTVTSIVIGAAAARGEFPSLDTPVLSFFDAARVANVDARKRRMTVRHLLTMTAGLEWDEMKSYGDTTNTAILLESSYDWVKFAIDRPMSEEPGTRYNYNSGATQLLAHVFRRATGADIEEYAARHLFAPLGITDWFWKRTPAGVVDTEGGLYLRSEDLAKLAYLFLKGGAWEGRQVVTPEWVRASVTPAVATGPAPGAARYGLKWWLYRNPVDSTRFVWGGSGFGGQFPLVVPEHDLVIVINQWNILPGRPSLPLRPTLLRLIRAVQGPPR